VEVLRAERLAVLQQVVALPGALWTTPLASAVEVEAAAEAVLVSHCWTQQEVLEVGVQRRCSSSNPRTTH